MKSVLAAGLFASVLGAQTYDVVLHGGRVMDPESGLDAVRDIAIAGRKIAAISTARPRGKTEIDAAGLVVAPGFIDLHSHGQTPENYRYQAMDGVTTALELEVGVYPAGEWYAVRAGKSLIHYGASSGHIPARMSVMHDTGVFLPRDAATNRLATSAEQKSILAADTSTRWVMSRTTAPCSMWKWRMCRRISTRPPNWAARRWSRRSRSRLARSPGSPT